ncbi:hypothetical protein CP03DC29_0836B, partial [Chlamydia psittaci 03DC29]
NIGFSPLYFLMIFEKFLEFSKNLIFFLLY